MGRAGVQRVGDFSGRVGAGNALARGTGGRPGVTIPLPRGGRAVALPAMKKLLLPLLLLLALVVCIVGLVLRDELDGAIGESRANEGVKTAVPADGRADEAGSGAAGAAGSAAEAADARRATTGALRVRATARAKDGTEAPLVDVLVLVFEGKASHEPVDGVVHRLRTDERGEAVFGSLAPGPFAVRAPSVRVATQHAEVAASGEALVELGIDDADVVRGIVVDANGMPVASADVWLVRDNRSDEFGVMESLELSSRRAGRSAANGIFEVLATDPRERRIAASHDAHGESMARYVQGGRHELRLVLQPATAMLIVRVLDQHDQPVADAAVEVRIGSDAARRTRDGTLVAGRRSRTERTGPDGTCSFPKLAPGRAQLTIDAPFHGRLGHAFDLVPDQTNDLVLRVGGAVLVHGLVRRERGLPEGAVVRIAPSRSSSGGISQCRVRPDGSYRLRAPKGPPFVVSVEIGERTLVDREFAEVASSSVRCDFVVDERAVTIGTLRSDDGQSLGLWRVRLTSAADNDVETLTDVAGRFALATREAGPFRARVFPLGREAPSLERDGVQPGEHLDLVVPRAAMPRGRVFGRLTDASGAPVAAGLRLCCRDPRVQHNVQSAADGSFAFDGVVPLQWTLEHLHSGNRTVLQEGIAIADGEARDLGTIPLAARGRLQVEVVDDLGRPWGGSAVGFVLYDEHGDEVEVDHVTIDAQFAVEAAPGKYRLAAFGTDLVSERIPVEIEAGRTGRARLSVRVGRSLRLRFPTGSQTGRTEARPLHVSVRDSQGALVLESTVTRAELLVDNNVYWLLPISIPFGPHRIEAATDDGLRFAMDLEVTESFDLDPVVDVPVVR